MNRWVFAVIALLVSGCIGGGEPASLDSSLSEADAGGASEAPQPMTELERELNATTDLDRPYRVDDWFVMPVRNGPDEPLTGFRWVVPDGAVATVQRGRETVVLEFAPILAPESVSSFGGWTLFGFMEEDGQAQLILTASRGPWHTNERWYLDAWSDDETPEFWAEPACCYWMGNGDVGAGREVSFVLATRSQVPADFALAFRVLPRDPWSVDPPDPLPQTVGEFLAHQTEPPRALQRLGSGHGYRVAAYVDLKVFQPTGEGPELVAYSYEGYTPQGIDFTKTVPEAAYPFVSLRETKVSTRFDYEEGWGAAWVLSFTHILMASSGRRIVSSLF